MSPPPPEYKKSFENDAQSSDNINFLKVQWSSRQLPTVRLGGEGTEGSAARCHLEPAWEGGKSPQCGLVRGVGMSEDDGMCFTCGGRGVCRVTTNSLLTLLFSI